MSALHDTVISAVSSVPPTGTHTFTPPSGETHLIEDILVGDWGSAPFPRFKASINFSGNDYVWMADQCTTAAYAPFSWYATRNKGIIDSQHGITVENLTGTSASVCIKTRVIGKDATGVTAVFTDLGSLSDNSTVELTAGPGKIYLLQGWYTDAAAGSITVGGDSVGQGMGIQVLAADDFTWVEMHPRWDLGPHGRVSVPYTDFSDVRAKAQLAGFNRYGVVALDVTNLFDGIVRTGGDAKSSPFTAAPASGKEWLMFGYGAEYATETTPGETTIELTDGGMVQGLMVDGGYAGSLATDHMWGWQHPASVKYPLGWKFTSVKASGTDETVALALERTI